MFVKFFIESAGNSWYYINNSGKNDMSKSEKPKVEINILGLVSNWVYPHVDNDQDRAKLENNYDSWQDGGKIDVTKRTDGRNMYTFLRYADKGKQFFNAEKPSRNGGWIGIAVTAPKGYVIQKDKLQEVYKWIYDNIFSTYKLLEQLDNGNIKVADRFKATLNGGSSTALDNIR